MLSLLLHNHYHHYRNYYSIIVIILILAVISPQNLITHGIMIHRPSHKWNHQRHYSGVTIGAMASRITSLPSVYLTVYSGADQRKHPRHWPLCGEFTGDRWPVNSPHKWPVSRKMFPFDDVIMDLSEKTTLYKRPRALSQYKGRLSCYRDSQYKDETVVRQSYLYNGNSHTGKTSLYIVMGPRTPIFKCM